ncbi:ABC transporter permease [Antarctobacter sp.]|uniref:ABC transporter permease n=1 Tax=Antarctobacter sp. TaxID=1872577 RepID=UPI003A956E77
MYPYLARRIGQGLISVVGVTVLIFVLVRLTGSPLDAMLPIDADAETRARLAARLGLDRPLYEQFAIFVGDLLHGDLGESIRYRVPVSRLLGETFPMTASLVFPALVLSTLVGIPLGIVAATTSRRSVRAFLSSFGLVGLAMPTFWLAILLIMVFSIWLRWLPSARAGGVEHYIMPVLTMSAFQIAALMRLTRASVLNILDSEYIKLARIKGLSEGRVIWKHALLNSLTAAASYLGLFFAALLTGSIVVETVFAWPGSGRLIYTSISSRDYPVIQGVVLVSSLFIIFVNLAVDLLQGYLDPRVRA